MKLENNTFVAENEFDTLTLTAICEEMLFKQVDLHHYGVFQRQQDKFYSLPDGWFRVIWILGGEELKGTVRVVKVVDKVSIEWDILAQHDEYWYCYSQTGNRNKLPKIYNKQ